MAVYNQTVFAIDPLYLQLKSYDARADRKWFQDLIGPGVRDIGHFAVSVSTGLVLNVAGGVAYILGANIADQGSYRQYSATNVNVTVPAHHGSLPRIDQVILRVMDNAADASGFNECRVEVVPGTATSGANLTNRSGAANLTALGEASKSVLLLADILVPATSGAITIGDRRVRSTVGSGLAISGGFPVGGTMEWNSASSPESVGEAGAWVEEDGSAINRASYPIAFARLGTGYGAGDGSTTFNIPDSRARVTVGRAVGGHVDHDSINDNDGLALAVRRVRHRHTVGNPTVTLHGHGGGYHDHGGGNHGHYILRQTHGFTGGGTNYNHLESGGGGEEAYYTSNSGNIITPQSVITAEAPSTSGGYVGPQTGNEPVDGAAYITKRKMLRVA